MSGSQSGKTVYTVPYLWRFLAAWLVFFLFLNYDPTGMSDAAERWLIRVVNYIGSPFYKSTAQPEIVIVMADRTALGELGWTWPLRFDQQSEIIGRIVEQGPRVLALDLLFLDKRADQGLEFLQDTVEKAVAKDGTPVPVVGAAPPYGSGSQPSLLNFTEEADIAVDSEWPDMGYRLVPGPREHNPSPPSLAFVVYRLLCDSGEPPKALCANAQDIDPRDYEREMLVFWGSAPADYRRLFGENSELAKGLYSCRGDPASVFERLAGLVLQQKNEAENTCAFHAVVPIDLVKNLDNEVLSSIFKDKVVFYGVDHPGIPDIVNPPTSQPIAGVHFHAMALDNLLTFGPDYFGAASRRLWGVGSLSLPTLRLLVAGGIFVAIFVLLLSSPPRRQGIAEVPVNARPVNDFADVTGLVAQTAGLFAPRRIWRDIRRGLQAWNRERDLRIQAGGGRPVAFAAWGRWCLGVIPALVSRSVTGRVLLLAGVFFLIVFLDIHVLRVPPINALTFLVIFGASQLFVPADILRPHPPKGHEG